MALTDGLVSFYKADNNWLDSSGNGHTITPNGAIFDSNGKINQAGSCDGVDDYPDPNHDGEVVGAISMWVKYNALPNAGDTVNAIHVAKGALQLNAFWNGSKAVYQGFLYDGSVNVVESTTEVSTSSFVHVVWNWNATTMEIFINAVSEDTGIGGIPNLPASPHPLAIGSRWDGAAQFSNFLWDELGYWNRNLTLAEISKLNNNGKGLSYPFIIDINTLTVGVATAIDGGSQDINVSMPYTDDDNTNSTYTIDYKLSSDISYINHVTAAGNTPSPYIDAITGLIGAETYDVRCTYIDPDGVTGANPQTITDIAVEALPNKIISKVVKNGFEYKVVRSNRVQKIIKRISIDKIVK